MKAIAVFCFVLCGIVYVQAQTKSCNGKVDKSFCPREASFVTVKRSTNDDDDGKTLTLTIQCLDDSNQVIGECSDQLENEYPGTKITSFRYSGNVASNHGFTHKSVNDIVRRVGPEDNTLDELD